MHFAYDSTQPHQLAAINAVLDLFQDHPTLSPRMVAVDIPGEAAGQTVPHLHLHVIPRRTGDCPDPRGGLRRVFPDKAEWWKSQ